MKTIREYREEPNSLSDFLKWYAIVAPGVILNKNGSLQTTFRYRGPDLDSATESELVTTSARLNNLLRTFKGGWAMYADAIRAESVEYPASEWQNPISHLIDEERRGDFAAGKYFETEYFLTFIWLPNEDISGKIESMFYEGGEKHSAKVTAKTNLQYFETARKHIHSMLADILPEVYELNDEESLTYLHRTVSPKHHKITPPSPPVELDYHLTDTALIGGFEPKLGDYYINVVTVKNFPTTSTPGILDQLNHHIAFPYRWVTRFVFFDKTEGERELNKIKKRLFAGRKSLWTLIKEMLTDSHSVMENTDAINKAMDADGAIQELASDMVNYGYFTQSIVLLEKDLRVLKNKTNEIERILNGLGFVTINEVSNLNCLDAWLGSIPGMVAHNIRLPILSTLNLAHLFPLSAVWAGPKENIHLSEVYSKLNHRNITAPPHIYAVTNNTVPFRLSLNYGDVGHTMVIGPTGSGKSVLLNILNQQWLRYPDAQIYIFDKGGSSRVLTAAMGGDFYDLGGENSALAFQPLAQIHDSNERSWARDWLLDILEGEKLPVTPEIKEAVWVALGELANTPVEQRTIEAFTIFVRDKRIKEALAPYIGNGPNASLLNSNYDALSYARWQTFEMEELINKKSALIPVLTYLFHRLAARFTGAPTLLVLDEAWVFLDNPMFQSQIREWLKVLRKSNVYVIFATQSLADVAESKIVATIKESCMTKIFLPNKNALDEESTRFYKQFGLNQRQIEILAFASPKRDYYFTSPNGNRLFSLGLSPLALAYCAATDKESQKRVVNILSNPHANFNLEYLKSLEKPLPWAVDFLQKIENNGGNYANQAI